MVDCCSEIFQVASSASAVATFLLVALRQLGAHVAKHVFAEIDSETLNPRDKAPLLCLVLEIADAILIVDPQDVANKNLVDVAKLPLRSILLS